MSSIMNMGVDQYRGNNPPTSPPPMPTPVDQITAAVEKLNLSIHSAVELAERQAAEIEELRKALGRIADCTDAPDIGPTGEWQLGLHCGVEDRDCSDRYKAADYGYTCGIERALEWAANEARAAIDAKLSAKGS